MVNKKAIDEMVAAREAMASALDAKIGNMPEWKAFRHADRAVILALDEIVATPAAPKPPPQQRKRINGAPLPYMTLADKALTETGKPLSTEKMVEYIRRHRDLPTAPGDLKRAKITIQSSLSKDERFRSVAWEGGRAWWYVDRPVPNGSAS